MSRIELLVRDTPVLSCRDDATGERTDLTRAELGSWVARTASLVRDGCGLRAGDRVLVDAGTAEQPVAWLLAPLVVGASVVVCANPGPHRAADEGVTHVL